MGFTPEALDDIQYDNLKSYNGNTYAEFGRRYNFIFQGVTASGAHIDEIYLLDAAKFLLQQNVISGLVGERTIPQTNSGVSKIISFCTNACERMLSIGIIAPGIWQGGNVLNLHTGDAIPSGYYIQTGSLSEQTVNDRKARKSPPIYVCMKAAGAIEYVVVKVFVNQ